MDALTGCLSAIRMCPQKLNTFWLTVSWNPFTKERVIIITATLITVADMERRIMKREKDFCWLKAMRRAIKEDRFTNKSYNPSEESNQTVYYYVC